MVIFNAGVNDLLEVLSGGSSNTFILSSITDNPMDSIGTLAPEEESDGTSNIVFNRTLQITGRFPGNTLSNPNTSQNSAVINFGNDVAAIGHEFTPVTLKDTNTLVVVFAIPMRVNQ